jgi:hypothetical protein
MKLEMSMPPFGKTFTVLTALSDNTVNKELQAQPIVVSELSYHLKVLMTFLIAMNAMQETTVELLPSNVHQEHAMQVTSARSEQLVTSKQDVYQAFTVKQVLLV